MQRFSSNKYLDRTTADSYATLFGSRIPMLFSDKRAEVLSKSVAAELEMTAEQDYHVKLSEPPYQEQDSSSTLSNGQSHEHTISFQTGPIKTCKTRGENSVEASVACGNADFPGYQLQTEHNQSLDWISYQLTAPCFGRMTTVYDPNAVVYPQMMGVAPGRVVLQPDCTQGIPVYVNAKQYHAILRRRQTRARLEAQNKVAKSRKPYLHESRHRHALKRARGSGGRFLNVKNVHQSKPKLAAKMAGKNLIQLMNKEPKTHLSESDSWRTSTTSGSNFSSIFNNDNIFQQPDLRVANSSLRSRLMGPDDSLMLTMDRRAQISTAT